MNIEIYLEGADAAIFHHCKTQDERPDVVCMGDNTLWRFYRFRQPKVGGNIGATYKRATVAHFPQMTTERIK